MEAEAAVGDVRHAEVLARGKQVLHASWYKCPKRDLERQRRHVDVVVSAGRRVQIDPVTSDADGIGISFRFDFAALLARYLHARICADMLLQNGELGFDSPRLPDIWGLRQPVLGADDILAQPQSFPACFAVGPGRFGLQPIQKR
jgi:hypothetical protein